MCLQEGKALLAWSLTDLPYIVSSLCRGALRRPGGRGTAGKWLKTRPRGCRDTGERREHGWQKNSGSERENRGEGHEDLHKARALSKNKLATLGRGPWQECYTKAGARRGGWHSWAAVLFLSNICKPKDAVKFTSIGMDEHRLTTQERNIENSRKLSYATGIWHIAFATTWIPVRTFPQM